MQAREAPSFSVESLALAQQRCQKASLHTAVPVSQTPGSQAKGERQCLA